MTEPATLANIDAEMIVLGAMMTSTDTAVALSENLRPASFYHPRHGVIFEHILDAAIEDAPVEPAAILQRLIESGEIKRAGGGEYLHSLVAAMPTVHHGHWYAKIVADFATRRDIVGALSQATQVAADPSRDLPDMVSLVQKITHDATMGNKRTRTVTSAELLDGTLNEVLNPNGPYRGLSTGVGSLDDVIGGLKAHQLTLIAARPGAGKSVLSVGIAQAAARHRIPVAFFSLEMSAEEIERRILAATCTVNVSRIMNGGLRDDEIMRLRTRSESIRDTTLHIDDTAATNLATIGAVSRRIQQNCGLGLIVVDYIQLMGTDGKFNSRTEEVGSFSRGLKLLAKELEVPVVAAAQVNRASEGRSDKRPQLSDLRESGSLEQDSDIVILLHRPDQHDQENERAGEIDLIVAKNRNGPLDTVTAAAQLEYSRIVDYAIPESH